MTVELQTFFGCDLRDLTTQLGLNQNPSVWTFSVVRDHGQAFSLAEEPREGIRKMEHVTLGALDMWGVVQSWEEQQIGISGSGLYTVRMTDMRTAMDGAEVVLNAPLGINFGQNVIPVYSEAGEDINSGIQYNHIRTSVENATLSYGSIRYRIDLSRVTATDRSVDGVIIPYRIRGGAMSLIALIQQVADDNGWDWIVDTSAPDANGVHTVFVTPLKRGIASLDMNGLASQHAGEVIRLNVGSEAREEVTRTVLFGAAQQYLSQEDASDFKPFWGFTEEGDVLEQPEFRILTLNGTPRRRVTSIEEMERALNNEITDLPDDELQALRSYAEDFWGKRFYAHIRDDLIDENGEPWVDVVSAGWWPSLRNPERFKKDGELRFSTDDGRWTSFVKLPDPGNSGGEWETSILTSQNILGTGFRRFYMKASVERVDLNRTEEARRRRGSIILVTLPHAMTAIKTSVVDGEQVTRKTRLSALDEVYVPIMDRRRVYGPWTSDDIIPEPLRAAGKTRVIIDSSLSPWTFGYRGIGHTQAVNNMNAISRAKVRTYVSPLTEVDTGELEVAGLPKQNLGTEIGTGTNITSIVVSYSIQGIRTTYKCNLYTHELGRYQKYYQDLVEKLRRDQLRNQNTLYPQQNYWALDKEANAAKKDVPLDERASDGGVGGGSFVAEVISREDNGPFYLCRIQKEVVVNGFVTLEPAMVGGVATTNLSEHPEAPARIPIGTYVRIRPARRIQLTDNVGQAVVAVSAWVMEEQAPTPEILTASVASNVGNIGTGPRYSVEVVSGSTGMLTNSELSKLTLGVVNKGEPLGSPGYLRTGEEITINWIKEDDQTYTPVTNTALNIFVSPE